MELPGLGGLGKTKVVACWWKCQAEEALKYLPQTCALYGLTGQQEHFVGKGLAGLLTIWPGRPLALKKMPGLEGLKIPPSGLCIVWPNRPARTLCWERPCRPSDYMAWQATGSKEMPGLEGLKIPPSGLCIVWPNRPARTLCWERPCRPSDFMAWQATGSKDGQMASMC